MGVLKRRRERASIAKVIWYLSNKRETPFDIYDDCQWDCATQHGTPVHVGDCKHVPKTRGRSVRHPLQRRYLKRKRGGKWLSGIR